MNEATPQDVDVSGESFARCQEAEENCLAVCFTNERAPEILISECGLRASHFSRESSGRIFAAIEEVMAQGRPVEPLTVADHIGDQQWFRDFGGLAGLHALVGLPALASRAREYARIVQRYASERQTDLIAQAILDRRVGVLQASEALREIAAESSPVPRTLEIMTACDLRDYVSPFIDWTIEKILAKGVLTIIGGKPKSGKTTILFGAVYAMLFGLLFMGLQTRRAKVLYITEQNKTTIRPKLDEYGLLDCPDMHIMFPRQMLGLGWNEIIDQAATYCEKQGIDVVIVDTVNDLCHLENTFSDTEWIAALDPLQSLAQHGGRAVLAAFHAKKELASLVDMFRGSNAIVGKADIVLGLWRDGSGDETTRTIEGMSRLDNGFDERTRIVREGREYLTAGTVKEMEMERKFSEYLAILPTDRNAGLTRQEIAALLEVTPGAVTTYLTKMIAAGQVLCETRPGSSHAKTYWALNGNS